MKIFAIWSEGYRTTGESAPAMCHGSAKGETFEEACVNFFKDDRYFSRERMAYWGCRLFDNEADARKSFG